MKSERNESRVREVTFDKITTRKNERNESRAQGVVYAMYTNREVSVSARHRLLKKDSRATALRKQVANHQRAASHVATHRMSRRTVNGWAV